MLIKLLEKAYQSNPEFIVMSAGTVRDYKIYLRSVVIDGMYDTNITTSPNGKHYIAYKSIPILRSMTCSHDKVYTPTNDESDKSCNYCEETGLKFVVENEVKYLVDTTLGFTPYKFLKEVVL